jgi:hypothetical protein
MSAYWSTSRDDASNGFVPVCNATLGDRSGDVPRLEVEVAAL